MKIVMMYTQTDGCTYASDCTLPINHESVEAAAYEFEQALSQAELGVFEVFNKEFWAAHFNDEYRPEFLTIDEWFDKYSASN